MGGGHDYGLAMQEACERDGGRWNWSLFNYLFESGRESGSMPTDEACDYSNPGSDWHDSGSWMSPGSGSKGEGEGHPSDWHDSGSWMGGHDSGSWMDHSSGSKDWHDSGSWMGPGSNSMGGDGEG